MRFSINLSRFKEKALNAIPCSTQGHENPEQARSASDSRNETRERPSTEQPALYRSRAGAGLFSYLIRKKPAGSGPSGAAANQRTENKRQRRTLEQQRPLDPRLMHLHEASNTPGGVELVQILTVKAVDRTTLKLTLQSALEGFDTVSNALPEISQHLATIKAGYAALMKPESSAEPRPDVADTGSSRVENSEMRAVLQTIKTAFDALEEMAFRTERANEPSPLRSMTTALRSLNDLTNGTMSVADGLSATLVRLSWDAGALLNLPLAIGHQTEENNARFQDLGDPSRYRQDQTDRPITEQVFGVHGHTIEREIAGLARMRENLAAVIAGLVTDEDPTSPVPGPIAGPSRTRRSSPTERSNASGKAARDEAPPATVEYRPLEYQSPFGKDNTFLDEVLKPLKAT